MNSKWFVRYLENSTECVDVVEVHPFKWMKNKLEDQKQLLSTGAKRGSYSSSFLLIDFKKLDGEDLIALMNGGCVGGQA